MEEGDIFPMIYVELQCTSSCHFLMISMKTLDRETQTTNETFDEHLVPNIHVATFYHAMERCEYRLWLHLPGLKLRN